MITGPRSPISRLKLNHLKLPRPHRPPHRPALHELGVDLRLAGVFLAVPDVVRPAPAQQLFAQVRRELEFKVSYNLRERMLASLIFPVCL